MKLTGELFIHQKNPSLQHSSEVEHVVAYLKQSGDKIPNSPQEKIASYLGFLSNKNYVNDGVLTGNKDSLVRQIEQLIISDDNVPESYFQLQQRIAFEQGHGHIEITPDVRLKLIEVIKNDQRASLNKWAEFINSPDANYPDWFKYYVWDSLKGIGQFDKEKCKFLKRTDSTTAAYPELNYEALAYVYDKLCQSFDEDIASESENLKKLLKGGNFGKLYANAMLEAIRSKEFVDTTEGTWKKYNQTDDPSMARNLSESLQGYGTGWCTAGEETASYQLKEGDFYVYYSKDGVGEDTIPRVAIRMDNDEVAEVRGILKNQELEPELYDITNEQLNYLPGGDEYKAKVADMKKVTKIYELVRENPEVELSAEELRFIYELDRGIGNFGHDADPRIKEIIAERNSFKDLSIALGVTADYFEVVKTLIDNNKLYKIIDDLDIFLKRADHFEVAKALIDNNESWSLFAKTTALHPGIFNYLEFADTLLRRNNTKIVLDNLDEFLAVCNPDKLAEVIVKNGEGWLVINHLDEFLAVCNPNKLASVLISYGWGRTVSSHSKKFELDENQKNQIKKMELTGQI
jgi:hypothetical protein